jgi:hypothetical protein
VANADVAMYQAKRSGGAGHEMHDIRDAHSPAHRPIETTAETHTEIEQLVGQVDFEPARGILMEVHGLSADEAFTLIGEVSTITGSAPEGLIAKLVSPTTRSE